MGVGATKSASGSGFLSQGNYQDPGASASYGEATTRCSPLGRNPPPPQVPLRRPSWRGDNCRSRITSARGGAPRRAQELTSDWGQKPALQTSHRQESGVQSPDAMDVTRSITGRWVFGAWTLYGHVDMMAEARRSAPF